MKIKEKKKTKYNYGEHIDLDIIPIPECNQALYEFSEDSMGLNMCLREMWQRGLKTYSCRFGDNTPFDIGHIVMEEKEDIFSYLSEEFLFDERIRIDIIDNKQEIKFTGNKSEKEGALLSLARNIQTGKKKNKEIVLKKIGEPYKDSWIRRLKHHESNLNSTFWSEKIYIKQK